MSEWRPIETADRYCGRVLVFCPNLGRVVASPGWANDDPEKIIWGVVNDIDCNPTHWMPLPKPPTEGDA